MTGPDSRSSASLPVLETRDVAVHYGGIKAVDGVSLRLDAGKIVGILGPNGSGKTTLLGAITRLAPLTRGDLFFEGESYATIPPHKLARRGITRTFQIVRLLQQRTVIDNIRLATDVSPVGTRAARNLHRERVERALELTGLAGYERMWPGELSYGVQRRVEIARAIAGNPRLLLLDEPTAGMNRHEREEMSGLMRNLRVQGISQLVIEHDVQMMVDTCDYLFAMNFGVIIAEGKPKEVVRAPAVQEAYLGKRWRQDDA